MERLKRGWRKTPSSIRKPIVLAVGSVFVVASLLTGWLPGPGGIPLFLIGIAILSTEFVWAQKLRDRVLTIAKQYGQWFKKHPILGAVTALSGIAGLILVSAILFFTI